SALEPTATITLPRHATASTTSSCGLTVITRPLTNAMSAARPKSLGIFGSPVTDHSNRPPRLLDGLKCYCGEQACQGPFVSRLTSQTVATTLLTLSRFGDADDWR